jgi:hypothetical protein
MGYALAAAGDTSPNDFDLGEFWRWLGQRVGADLGTPFEEKLLAATNGEDEAIRLFFSLWDEFNARD